jgi:hypothetical protein
MVNPKKLEDEERKGMENRSKVGGHIIVAND